MSTIITAALAVILLAAGAVAVGTGAVAVAAQEEDRETCGLIEED